MRCWRYEASWRSCGEVKWISRSATVEGDSDGVIDLDGRVVVYPSYTVPQSHKPPS